jgi:menaquinone-dependent protoporphyrinogen oxidase
MTVLVAHASRHGSTAGIAERIAQVLRTHDMAVEVRPVAEVRDLEPYDAVVLGAAAYMTHWLKDATAFARRHQAELGSRPLWLFSSGPLGTDLVDGQGRDVVGLSRPREFPELTTLLHPRGERVFFGAWDPDAPPIGAAERFVRHLPAARDALPAGDFRDWAAIEAWAEDIALDLQAGQLAPLDS